MFNIPSQLAARDDPVRTGIIGTGLFGTNIVSQLEQTEGLEATAVADVRTDKAVETLESVGVPSSDVNVVTGLDEANRAIADDQRPVLEDGELLAKADVDVIVEATGAPEFAAKHAYTGIQSGTHVVMATVEVDTVIGPFLAQMAENRGVTYTMAYGDQPSLIVELCDWAEASGLDVVAAGKGNVYRDEFLHGTPDDVFDRIGYSDEFVEEHGLNPRIYNQTLDGTKAAIEMCAVANALGFEPDVPGMHNPTAGISDIPDQFRPEEDGGVLHKSGVVDTISSLHPDGSSVEREQDITQGVFIVTTTPDERVQQYLGQVRETGLYTANDGKYQLFYRPHHLPGFETTVSVAYAALRNEATGVPREQSTEVVAGAKSGHEAGEEVDGTYSVYGKIVDAEEASEKNYVPFELLDDATFTSSVEQDEILTYDDVRLHEDSLIYKLRQVQDETR